MSAEPLAAEAGGDLPPAKLAAKYARAVHRLAGEIVDGGQVGRVPKLERLMADADAMTGVCPGPDVPELGAIGTAAFHHALAAFYRRHARLDAVIEACAAGVAVDPYDLVLRRRWLEALHAARRLEEAGPVLELPADIAGGPGEAAAFQLLLSAEKLLQLAGAEQLALRALEQAAALRPSDNLDLQLVARAAAAGDMARADGHRERVRGGWAGKLPERLADGLAALRGLGPAADPPEAALAWAWALADQQTWSREDWRRELDWSARANKLLLQWWLTRPERGDELAELAEAPDFGPLRAAQASGRAQVVTGCHGGPSPVALRLLETSGLPFRTLGGVWLDQISGGQGTLIAAHSPAAASRELIREIRRAAVLAVTADAPTAADRLEVDFLGRRAAIKSLPARLAQRHDCDTWWCQPLWRGDRVIIELERLPDPEPDEPAQDWAERWARAYLKRLKRVMRGDPRNLNLTGGIWRFAEARISL